MRKKHDSARRGRVLAFERLESRELLSVNPLVNSPSALADTSVLFQASLLESSQNAPPDAIEFTLPSEGSAPELSNAIRIDALVGYELVFADTIVGDRHFANLLGIESVAFTTDTECTITCAGNAYEGRYSCVRADVKFSATVALPLELSDEILPGYDPAESYSVEFTLDARDPISLNNGYASGYVRVADSAMTLLGDASFDAFVRTTKTLSSPKLASLYAEASVIYVDWQGVDDATDYQIIYRQANTTQENFFYAPSYERSAQLYGLAPNTTYEVKVVARGDGQSVLDSAASAFATVKTASYITLAQPTVTVDSVGKREVEIEWNEVPNGRYYEVSYRDTRWDWTGYAFVDAWNDGARYCITGLEPGATYKISVVALGDGLSYQTSKNTASKTVTTQSLAELAKPTITKCVAGKRTLDVTWKAVDGVDGYYVSYNSVQTWESGRVYLPADATTYSFSNLTPGVTYQTTVVAIPKDPENTAQSMATSKATTKALAVLAQPTIKTVASDTTSLFFTWKAVKNARGYQVSVDDPNANARLFYYVDAATTEFALDSLAPGTSYVVRVVALGDGIDTQNSKDTAYKKITTKSLATLATPTIKTATSDKRSIEFAWNAVKGATGYVATYATTDGNAFSLWLPGDQTSYKFDGLTPGTAYTVKVRACGDNLTTQDSKDATKKISTKALVTLTQPTVKAGTVESRSIEISWNSVSNAVGYEVSYRAKNSTETTVVFMPVNLNSFVFYGAEPKTAYVFKVVAKGDGIETLDSKDAASKTITTKALTTLAKPVITSCQTSDSAILVNWKLVEGADQIAVEYKKAGTDDWQVKFVSGSNTSFVLRDLEAGAKYSVRVTAFGDGYKTLNSPVSATKTATLAQAPKLLAPAIDDVGATAVTAAMKFDSQPNVASYEVAYRKSGSTSWTKLVFDTNAPSIELKDLKPNQSYGVKIRALGVDGWTNSDYCQEATFRTAAQTKLAAPTNFNYGSVAANSLVLSWSTTENALGYQVECVCPDGTTRWYDALPGASSITISGLSSQSNYKFRVRAIGDDDYFLTSAFSRAQNVQTLDDNHPPLDDSPSLPTLGD